jgi:hypothetical protein
VDRGETGPRGDGTEETGPKRGRKVALRYEDKVDLDVHIDLTSVARDSDTIRADQRLQIRLHD